MSTQRDSAVPHVGRPNHELIAQLGGGGMANVYLVKLTGGSGFSKLAVVKRLRPLDEDEVEFLTMFASEARLSARLNHPNIVQTFEVGEDEHGPFLVMEHIEGQTFGRIRSRANRRGLIIPHAVSLRILRDVLTALAYAHSLVDHDGSALNVVHRDVSPENIMLTYAGLTKLVDFGVAKTAASLNHTRAGVIKGKLAYMAPEQARTEESIDGRADIFSAGLILWEMLTRRRIWEGLSETEMVGRLVSDDPLPRVSAFASDVPLELDEICARALEKRAVDRFASANDFVDALEAACRKHDLQVSAREVGAFVADLFATERENVRAIISGSMSKAEIEQSFKRTVVGQEFESWSGTARGPSPTPLMSLSSVLPAPGDGSKGRGGTSDGVAESIVAPPRRSRVPWGAVVGASLAATALAGVAFIKKQPAPPPASANAVIAPVVAAPKVEIPADVSLEVKARPAKAKILIDGKVVEGNPHRARVPRSAASHEIRVEAPGHEARSFGLAFDSDHVIDTVLVPLPPAPPRWTPPPPRWTPPARAVPARPAASAAPPAAATPPPSAAASEPVAASASPTTRAIGEIDATRAPASQPRVKIDTDIFKK